MSDGSHSSCQVALADPDWLVAWCRSTTINLTQKKIGHAGEKKSGTGQARELVVPVLVLVPLFVPVPFPDTHYESVARIGMFLFASLGVGCLAVQQADLLDRYSSASLPCAHGVLHKQHR